MKFQVFEFTHKRTGRKIRFVPTVSLLAFGTQGEIHAFGYNESGGGYTQALFNIEMALNPVPVGWVDHEVDQEVVAKLEKRGYAVLALGAPAEWEPDFATVSKSA